MGLRSRDIVRVMRLVTALHNEELSASGGPDSADDDARSRTFVEESDVVVLAALEDLLHVLGSGVQVRVVVADD